MMMSDEPDPAAEWPASVRFANSPDLDVQVTTRAEADRQTNTDGYRIT